MTTSKIQNTAIKHTTITGIIAAKANGAGVYSDTIPSSRVVNVMCAYDNANSVNHPISVQLAYNQATRIAYIHYIDSASVSQTESREYTLDVFYV